MGEPHHVTQRGGEPERKARPAEVLPQNNGTSSLSPPCLADSWGITPGRQKSIDRASSKGAGVSLITLAMNSSVIARYSITAVASTSTSHSGLTSAETATSVAAGNGGFRNSERTSTNPA